MAITIANLIAQIGADVSQFNIGMNEVEARMRLAEVRARESDVRTRLMRERSAQLTENADIARAQRARTRAALPALRNDVLNMEAEVTARGRAALAADQAEATARASGTTAQVDAAARRFETATRAFQAAERRLRAAEGAVEANVARESRLGLVEGRLRGRAATVAARAVSFDEENAAAQEVARRYAARLAQNAQEHRVRAYNAVAAASERAGVVLGVGLGVATKIGSDFNQMLVTTGHNTSLTAAGLQVMGDTVKRLGVESGAPMDKLADGFRAIENRGYSAADAVKILAPAMQASVAKGSDLAATTTLLTNVMKEFFIPVERAADAMGMLVEISRRSGVTMEDMTHVFGQMTAISGNFGVSLAETGAAFVTFTKHGLNAAQAATQFKNDLNKIINPTKKTKDAIADIFKETGVNLKPYFTGAGLRTYQPSGVFQKIDEAAARYKGGVQPSDLTNRLFPNLRGQVGAAIATGTGAKDYVLALSEIKAASAGGANVNRLYQESLGQVNQQFERLKNSAIVAAGSIANALAPDIKHAIDNVNGLIAGFSSLDAETKTNTARFLAMAASTLVLGGLLGKLVVGVGALNTALLAMGTEGLGALVVSAGPAVLGIAGLIAAIGGLVYVIDRAEHAQQRAAVEATRHAAANEASAEAAYANQRAVVGLIARYDRLHSTSRRTSAQNAEMQDILNRLSVLTNGSLTTGFDTAGNAIGLMGNYARDAAMHLLELEAATRRAHAATIDLQITQEQNALRGVGDQRRDLQRQLSTQYINRPTGVVGAFRPATPREIAEHVAGLQTVPRHNVFTGAPIAPDYRMPMPTMTQGGTPQVFGRQSPEMARVAEGLRVQNQEYQRHEQALRDLAMRRQGAMTAPLLPQPPGFDMRNVGAGPAGPDKMNELGGRAAKKEKETEAERDARRLQDRYQALMEGFAQQRFLAAHEGKEGEAMWETQTHGVLQLFDGIHQLNGEFSKYPAYLRDALVAEAKRADALAANVKWLELQKNAELKLFELQKNPDGTERTPAQVAAKKASLGMYKEYGAHATDAMFSEIGLANAEKYAQIEAKVKKFRDEANKPLEKMLSVHDQMVKDIKAEQGLYEAMGAAEVERLAVLAQRNSDMAESGKLYADYMEKAAEAHDRMSLAIAGDDSELSAERLELKKRMYDSLNPLQRMFMLGAAKLADIDQRSLDIAKARRSLGKDLGERVTQAGVDVAGAGNPAEQRWLEFRQKAIDHYGDTWDKLNAKQRAEVEHTVADAFGKVESLGRYEKMLHETGDIMEAVSKGTEEINNRMKMQAGDVKVTTAQWDRLNETQKQAVRDYSLLFDVNATIQEGLQGLAALFGKTLDDIREHGFRRFFQDVLAGFDSMLYDMAKKWAESQVLKLLTSAIGGLFGGGGNTVEYDPGSAIAGALASGGPVQQGMSYIVGENGPEVFKPGSSGRVVSNQEAFGGGSFTLNLYGVTDASSFQASRHQVAATIGRLVAATGSR